MWLCSDWTRLLTQVAVAKTLDWKCHSMRLVCEIILLRRQKSKMTCYKTCQGVWLEWSYSQHIQEDMKFSVHPKATNGMLSCFILNTCHSHLKCLCVICLVLVGSLFVPLIFGHKIWRVRLRHLLWNTSTLPYGWVDLTWLLLRSIFVLRQYCLDHQTEQSREKATPVRLGIYTIQCCGCSTEQTPRSIKYSGHGVNWLERIGSFFLLLFEGQNNFAF